MNEHQLLCFLTVSRTLNFSAAARELYCTQPALSYQIRSLEKELDAALFRRTTTLGALVSIAVLGNVAMLNYCYDVPVKQPAIPLP